MNRATRLGRWAALVGAAGCFTFAAPLAGVAQGLPQGLPQGSPHGLPPGTPEWVVQADDPGPNLPPAGRSLFDRVFSERRGDKRVYRVPYPFPEFIEHLARHTEGHVRGVLIPFGRSLQRSAAPDDYFGSPRVVVAVTSNGAGGDASVHAPLENRLFAGFQERAGIIEVISYNEAAGRFEFQVVQNYRANASPEVRYADRALCSRCHQNTGPIFSRPLWDETNANPDIGARLEAVAESFHGVPAAVAVDVPDAIDAATDRAGELLLYQKIWQDGCASVGVDEVRCRAELVLEALRYALAGKRHERSGGSPRDVAIGTLQSLWQQAWPNGLAVADPDVPNRRLLVFAAGPGPLDLPAALARGRPLSSEEVTERSRIPPELEPFQPRPPREIWDSNSLDPARMDALVDGLASFFSRQDVSALDDLLRAQPPSVRRIRWTAACRIAGEAASSGRLPTETVRVLCGNPADPDALALTARLRWPEAGGSSGRGLLHRLSLPGHGQLRHAPIAVRPSATDPDVWLLEGDAWRTRRGDAVGGIALRIPAPDPATIEVELVQDFALLGAAVSRLAQRTQSGASASLGRRPLERCLVLAPLFDLLGGTYSGDCHRWAEEMPPPVLAGNVELDRSGTLPPELTGSQP